ncbi:Aerotolerance protein BatA [hydrothermal vent metagenome]|uniref:Aerotolerance protein BatA n=1 Tax=hydrothermal vent metagenome TaxID=652676 RepID=A0A3B0X621_9ZZZZ
MMSFIWQWAFAILPLPFILRFILPRAKKTNDAALRVSHLSDFQLSNEMVPGGRTARWPLLLYSLAWICLVIALARPQWTGDTIELPVSGRDLMLAIDISMSMDLPIHHNSRSIKRITATKAVASSFIEKRVGDRIGLILFGDQAYVQSPLTFDRTTVNVLLQEAVTGLAGQATAIGDAIGLAVKRLDTDKTKAGKNSSPTNTIQKNVTDDRILILLTDGVSNRGEITPLKAAELAAKKGLKIHTIGIGNRGSRELDENTLRRVARITGGQYFRAYNTNDLVKIYALLDELEPVEKDTKSYRPIKTLFYIPLTASVVLAALLALLLYAPQFSYTIIKPLSNRSEKKQTS